MIPSSEASSILMDELAAQLRATVIFIANTPLSGACLQKAIELHNQGDELLARYDASKSKVSK